MEPIEAFDDTHNRAVRLLRYHDGLINTRQRSIRSDWKASFCRLMHWRQDCEIDRVDSRDAVIVLRNPEGLQAEDFGAAPLEDLLRCAITFGVSALDRYVHERIIKQFVTSFRGSDLTKNQREFQMPATITMEIVTRVHAARRDGNAIRPANEIRKAVQTSLHKRPFQSWREIEYGFSLIGCKDLGKALRSAHSLTKEALEEFKQQHGRIIGRRNQIVHEGDLPRHQRGGQVYVQEIRRRWVEESLEFLKDFAYKLESVA